MVRRRLQRHVETHFGMRLDEFIQYHHQEKLQTDGEIADILSVNLVMIGRLRKEFGIKKADRFSRRFRTTYGEDALAVFQEMVERPDASLSDVARHFGFSRQYASALCKKVYGRCYSETCRRAREAKNADLEERPRKPKQLKQVLAIKDKMESLGFAVRVHRTEYGCFLESNGFSLAVRSTSVYRSRGRREYFQATNLKGAARFDYDFLVVVCMRGKDHAYYIIPRKEVPVSGLSLIPQDDSKSKYTRFKEAWRLLVPPKGAQLSCSAPRGA